MKKILLLLPLTNILSAAGTCPRNDNLFIKGVLLTLAKILSGIVITNLKEAQAPTLDEQRRVLGNNNECIVCHR